MGVVADPVDLGVGLDDRVAGVDEDDLVPLVLTVGSYPVGVKDLKVGESLLSPFLSDPLHALSDGDLEDTLSLGPPSCLDLPLSEGSLSDPSPDEDVSLLCFVTDVPCLVEPCGLLDAAEVLFSSPSDPSLFVEFFQVADGGILPSISDV